MTATKPQPQVSSAVISESALPITVIIPVRNEARNLPRCLGSLGEAGQVFVVDSQSSDGTAAIAESFGAKVIQFHYRGGWPKKRQWAMDSLDIAHDWILLLDADEVVTPELANEIRQAIRRTDVAGYRIRLEICFLGRTLRHCDASFWKLALFRKGAAHYECRLKDQDKSMADMEVHEHIVANGPTAELCNALVHHNVESLSHYIEKHNEYSNWEARVLLEQADSSDEMKASLFGNQAERRRWLKKKLYRLPGSPVLLFLYRYIARLGFLDGAPGLIYCGFQAVQMFHTKSKIYELRKVKG